MSVSPSAERKKEFLEDLRLGRDSKDSKASIQARNDGDEELAIEIEAKRLLRKYRVSVMYCNVVMFLIFFIRNFTANVREF